MKLNLDIVPILCDWDPSLIKNRYYALITIVIKIQTIQINNIKHSIKWSLSEINGDINKNVIVWRL